MVIWILMPEKRIQMSLNHLSLTKQLVRIGSPIITLTLAQSLNDCGFSVEKRGWVRFRKGKSEFWKLFLDYFWGAYCGICTADASALFFP